MEVEGEGERGSRWVSHLVDGRKAGEMKRRGRVGWRDAGSFMGNIHACK